MSARITARLLGQRNFLPMLIAFAFGGFNDNIIKFSLMMLTAYGLLRVGTLEPQYVASIAANTYAGAIFLFSALGGQMADKWNRSLIMRRAKLFEVFLMMFVGIGFFLQSEWILFAGLFLMAAQSAIFAPARLATMPYFLDKDELVPGNGLFSGTNSIFVLAGSLVGTMAMIHQLPDGGFGVRDGAPLLVTSILVTCALIGWAAIRFLPSSPAPDSGMKINWNFLWETFVLLGFVFRQPDVRRPVIGVGWFYTMAGAFLVILPTMVKEIFRMGSDVVAVFIVIFSIGGALGSIVCGVLSHKGNALVFSILGLAMVSVSATDIWWLGMHYHGESYGSAMAFIHDPRNWHLLAAMLSASFFAGMFVVPLQALTQYRANPKLRARILAGSALMNAAAAIIGQFILVYTGLLGWPVPSAFLLMGVVSALGAAYMIVARVRNTF